MFTQIRHRQLVRYVAFQLEDDADFIRGLVSHVEDLRKLSSAHELSNLLDQLGLVDGIGKGGNDNLPFPTWKRFDLPLPTQFDGALAGFINFSQLTLSGENLTARREIRTFDVLQQIRGREIRIINHGD